MTAADPSRRAHYLEALGIDAWVSRRAPPPLDDTAPGDGGVPADAWRVLRAEVAGCVKCRLCETRTQTVFGVGDPRARWLIVGEAPGAEEDRRGEPFVGRAGRLLDAMLRAVGLTRDTVFIANVLKCRPPGNRDPAPDEIASCLPYLQRQLALIEPDIIVAVGRIAAQTLIGTDAPVARLRGRIHQFGPAGTPLVVTYHPAYLLRAPGEKRKAWDDLKLARETARGRRAG
ncbi:MAG: uracil-DNA glycosylase family protein [Steroidobacteraceae bacterium]